MSMTSPSLKDDHEKTKQAPKVRPELPYPFEKELIEKQNKRIYIVDEFVSAERVTPIEGKFYSKFNNKNIKDIAQRQSYWESTEKLRIESRMKQGFPLLESQTYGWMPKSFSVMTLKRMNYVQAPKRRCSMTIYGEKLSCEKVTQRPKFNGERFHLS